MTEETSAKSETPTSRKRVTKDDLLAEQADLLLKKSNLLEKQGEKIIDLEKKIETLCAQAAKNSVLINTSATDARAAVRDSIEARRRTPLEFLTNFNSQILAVLVGVFVIVLLGLIYGFKFSGDADTLKEDISAARRYFEVERERFEKTSGDAKSIADNLDISTKATTTQLDAATTQLNATSAGLQQANSLINQVQEHANIARDRAAEAREKADELDKNLTGNIEKVQIGLDRKQKSIDEKLTKFLKNDLVRLNNEYLSMSRKIKGVRKMINELESDKLSKISANIEQNKNALSLLNARVYKKKEIDEKLIKTNGEIKNYVGSEIKRLDIDGIVDRISQLETAIDTINSDIDMLVAKRKKKPCATKGVNSCNR